MDINKIQQQNRMIDTLRKHNLINPENNISNNQNSPSKSDEEIKILKSEIRELKIKLNHSNERITTVIQKMNEMITEINSLKEKPRPVQKTLVKNDPNKPIDRNNVAPKDVSVEKYFYFGKK